jgi:hypothetical protein
MLQLILIFDYTFILRMFKILALDSAKSISIQIIQLFCLKTKISKFQKVLTLSFILTQNFIFNFTKSTIFKKI